MEGSECPYIGGGGVGDLPQDDDAATLAGADLLSTGGHLHLGQGCGPGGGRGREDGGHRTEGQGFMSKTCLLTMKVTLANDNLETRLTVDYANMEIRAS